MPYPDNTSPNPHITGITVSLSFGDKSYGSGTESFSNVSAKWGESENPSLDSVIDQGLLLYMTVWKTILAGRWSTGAIKAEEFKQALQNSELRLDMVRKYLSKGVIQP